MAGKGDGGNLRQERGQRISDLGLQAVYKGTGRGKLSFGKCSELERKKDIKVAKMQISEERTHGVERAATTCTRLMKKSENIEETPDNDEELQAWCLLEESDNEQWQEVVSSEDKSTKRHRYVWRTVQIRAQRKLWKRRTNG